MDEGPSDSTRQVSAPNQDEPTMGPSITEITQAGLKAVMDGVKKSNALPSGQKRDLYETYGSFHQLMNSEGKRVLQLIHMVLQYQNIRGNIIRRDNEEKFDLLVEANDTIFEKVGTTLDELSGIRKNPEPVLVNVSGSRPISGSWNKPAEPQVVTLDKEAGTPTLLTAKNIERPQLKFKEKVNNSNLPWMPGIKDKPNSLKPLAIFLEVFDEGEVFCHPYEYELERFTPADHQLVCREPIKPREKSETPLVLVERSEQLDDLINDLRSQSEIAVDVEHHSYRSFQGFTCLLQISTREKDYIIDALTLRSDLHVLNEVFTSPKILKVFHGARSDIEWLQHDLNVYVVNMFDTHEASKTLNFPRMSLAFLLKHYCSFDANKQFQFADWRIRPLPAELLDYARSDTHYLLYIYDRMRNALLEQTNGLNLLKAVYQRSTEVCMRRYLKPIFSEDSHLEFYRRCQKNFDNRQMYAFKHLFEWRNKVAREEDDSTGFVLPNHMLLNVAETLPREAQGILACCNPIPPLVRQYLAELHQIILKAREQPLVKPVIEEELRTRPLVHSWAKMNMEDPLYCPHDLSQHEREIRDDLPTLLQFDDQTEDLVVKTVNSSASTCAENTFDRVKTIGHPLTLDSNNDIESPKSLSGLYSCSSKSNGSPATAESRKQQVRFLSPFERYKRARAYMDTVDRKKQNVKNGGTTSQTTSLDRTDGDDMDVEPTVSISEDGDVTEIKHIVNFSPAPVLTGEDMVPLGGDGRFKRRGMSLKRTFNKLFPSEEKEKAMRPEQTPATSKPKKKKKKPKGKANPPKSAQDGTSQGGNSQEGKVDDQQSENQASQENSSSSKPVDLKQLDYSRFQGGSRQNKRLGEVEKKLKGVKRNKGGKFKKRPIKVKT